MSRPTINHFMSFLKCQRCGIAIEVDAIYYSVGCHVECSKCYISKAFKDFEKLGNGGEIDNRFEILDL